jgi:hypothetical protein
LLLIGLSAPILATNTPYHPTLQSAAPYYGKLIDSTKIVVMLAISRKGLARHLRELRKALRPTVRGFRGESQIS